VIDREWREFVESQRVQELDAIISDERLDEQATRDLIENAMRDGALPSAGSAVSTVLPPISHFDHAYGETKARVLAKLAAFIERFGGLGFQGGRDQDEI